MAEIPGFTVDVYQNEYLPDGGSVVDAVVTVYSSPLVDAVPTDAVGGAEIIILDCSGSMSLGRAFDSARHATAVAIDTIRDGVAFAVIAGTRRAECVFPPRGGMAVADARSREAAKLALTGLRAKGGTAMGKWLLLARELFTTRPDRLRHAILLTDGINGEFAGQLDRAIQQCVGVFTCDCRGVGVRWKVSELRKVSTALLGTVDIVPDPAGLAAEFESLMRSSMSKQIADIGLRVWTPEQASVRFLKQVAPSVEELTGRGTASARQAADYPTGAWAAGESRAYHLRVEVPPAAVGREVLAGRVSVVAEAPSGVEVLAQGLVRAVWTGDAALSARIDPQVAHYTGQEELAQLIRDGLAARKAGDEPGATAKLGRAVALAQQSGNEEIFRLLTAVVDVEDAASGTVRLKRRVADADEMALDSRSVKTVRVGNQRP